MKENLKISAADGFGLSATSFTPRKFNNRVILINSATGVKQSYYSDFAAWLCEQGFRVFTYDYRGIGSSRPRSLKGFQASMHEWGTIDYHSVLKYLFLAFPDAEFTVIGHSIGGQIIGMSPLSENVDNIVMVGAQTPFWKNYNSRLKLFAFWKLMIPIATKIFGYFPAKSLRLFEDLPAGVATQWARWANRVNYLFDDMPFMKERFANVHQPSLMVSFSDDEYAPLPAVKQLMSFYKNLDWTHLHLKPEDVLQKEIGHFKLFRKSFGSCLWKEVAGWINNRSIVQVDSAKAA